ncbi:unnamed protein product [Ectocarpus sp. 12 AP-2014]
MSSKFAPDALHSTLQNLCQIGLPFGGKTILFSGDWRQVAPVLPFGTESEIVEHAFLSLYLWSQVHRFRLTKCMRDKDDIPCAKPVLLSCCSDKIIKDDENMPHVVSVAYLNSIKVPGTPPYKLNLKVGALIFFITNIDFDCGRFRQWQAWCYSRNFKARYRRRTSVEHLSDESPIVKIPRICFDVKVESRGIAFHRYQFPVRLCYAMAINKSRG